MNLILSLFAVLVAVLIAPVIVHQAKAWGREFAVNSVSPQIRDLVAYNNLLADLAGGAYPVEQAGSGFEHERVTGFNDSLFVQSTFSEPLTAYARGFRDPSNIESELEFIAPEVPTGRRFEYSTHSSPEEFLSDATSDDLRGIGADFKTVRYNSTKENARLLNRGLAIDIDLDEIDDMPGWEEYYTGKLLRRLKRNSFRRAVALLAAAATNTNKTWSTAAGKDPDGDVAGELITAQNISGIRPNRILYGATAWNTRYLSHRAQDTAGGYASAGLSPEQLASQLMVDGVQVSQARYSSKPSATSVSEVVSTKVLMFAAEAGADREDPSNIKRFIGNVSGEAGGGRVGVYLYKAGDKKWRLAVEHYELIAITSTLGIRQFTIAAS